MRALSQSLHTTGAVQALPLPSYVPLDAWAAWGSSAACTCVVWGPSEQPLGSRDLAIEWEN
jgi:hypothetical protein